MKKKAKVSQSPATRRKRAGDRKKRPATPPYLDASLPTGERVADLISRMTIEEKVSQMVHDAPAIGRLGIPPYNWWNECLHGVARAGRATVFPQAIGLAATWNDALVGRVAAAISDEARAKHHAAVRRGQHEMYLGLTFWSPNINIFRDPRWGRGHETYGECPVLTARMGVAFVRGLQGNDQRCLKLVATPKHYAAHSGPERLRHGFDAVVSQRDLWDTYLPAFEACVRQGRAASIMGAYNRTNGQACCASPVLLQEILRDRWGFEGFVVSDCEAIDDIWKDHGLAGTAAEAAAMAVRSGCELNCGSTYSALLAALDRRLITEAQIEQALARLLAARFRLGMFDPPAKVPYARISPRVIDQPKHRALALRAARESIVLLKNQGNLLPLRKDLRSILVVGANAESTEALVGNYNGWNGRLVSIAEGIVAKVSPATRAHFCHGCTVSGMSTGGFGEARWHAKFADVILVVLGLSPQVEGEQNSAADTGGDRTNLELPGVQQQLLQELHKTGKPIVLLLLGGSAMAVNWADENTPAILCAWYPGQAGGQAVADVLFGDYNPAGRLPVTFYKSVEQLPPFESYAMAGRTYRYFSGEPLYPFGYGLSYTRFAYTRLAVKPAAIGPADTLAVSVDVRNMGKAAGDEVVQLYISDLEASAPVPVRQLAQFRRIHLKAGQKRTLRFSLGPRAFSLVDEQGRRLVEPGRFRLSIGGGQPGTRSESAGSGNILSAEFSVVGRTMCIDGQQDKQGCMG